MHRPRRSTATARVTALTVLLLVGCSSGPPPPTPEEIAASELAERRFEQCGRLAEEVRDTLQTYVDQFAPATDAVDEEPASLPAQDNLAAAAEAFRRRRASLGCLPREFQLQMTNALGLLEGVGPLGRAVVAQVRDSILATPGPPSTVQVAPGDDLIGAVHDAGPGALIQLAAGRHVLDEPLVLLRATTFVGVGSGSTTIVSSGPGAAILSLGVDTVSIEGLSIVHEGDEPASVLVISSGSYALDDVGLRGGVADEGRATGWELVLGGAPDSTEVGVRTETLVGLTVEGNAAGGVVVTDDRAPAISGLVAKDNASCGICYLGSAAGSMRDSELSGNETGLSLGDQAAPVITDVTLTGNTVTGLLADASSAGSVTGATVTGNGDVGMAVTGESTIELRDVMVDDHGEVAVLVEGSAHPVISASQLVGAPVGLLVRGSAVVDASDLDVDDVTEAHIVFADEAGGTFTGGSCGSSVPGVVLLDSTTTEVSDTTCERLDQRS